MLIHPTITALLLTAFTTLPTHAQTTIHIVSDTHVLAPEYAAQLKDKYGGGMLTPLSSDILKAAVDSVIAQKVDGENTFFLIAGDMSYNGERSSHEFVAAQLARLNASGIQTMVIPGNHDILNNGAKHSKTADGTAASMVDRNTYRRIYEPSCYATVDESFGLSYVKRLSDRLAIICLDDALDDGGVSYFSDGALNRETIDWMKAKAQQLHAEKRAVIAAVHHHVIEHHMYEHDKMSSRMLNATPGMKTNYNISNADIQKAFADAGIEYVFTGHYHAHDAQHTDVTNSEGTPMTLYDIATGSLSSINNYIRTLRFTDDDKSTSTSEGGVSGELSHLNISATKVSISYDPALLRERNITDWYATQTFREYADSCLTVSNLNFTSTQVKERVGGMASLVKSVIPDIADVLFRFFAGEDTSGTKIASNKSSSGLLSMLKALKPDLYYIFDSMSKNYAVSPDNVTPDINIQNLPVTTP